LPSGAKWLRAPVTAAGGNDQGTELNQLKHPLGLRVDIDRTLYIADYGNHRVVAWKPGEKTGRVLAGGNGKGSRADQLNSPTDVIIDPLTNSLLIADYGNKRVVQWALPDGKQGETIISNVGCWGLAMDDVGSLYVADYDRHEVKRYEVGEIQGTVVAGGNGPGSHLDQLPCPTYVFVDRNHSVYVSDHNNHRVMKWRKNASVGVVVAGGEGQGNGCSQLSHPSGIVGDQFGAIYVADHFNDRVMRWSQSATEGTVIIAGNQSGQLSFPIGLTLDSQDRLYVTDTESSRVQKYHIDRS
jgi:DNA-binding beta-propeller fold protein YncE